MIEGLNASWRSGLNGTRVLLLGKVEIGVVHDDAWRFNFAQHGAVFWRRAKTHSGAIAALEDALVRWVLDADLRPARAVIGKEAYGWGSMT